MLNHLVVGMISSALALASAILLTVPPHPGQDVSPVNIVAESDCLFRPAPRTDRGLPDGIYRNDVRFTGTHARARAGGSAGTPLRRRASEGQDRKSTRL